MHAARAFPGLVIVPYPSMCLHDTCVYLQVYKLYSELISKAIAEGGPYAAKSQIVKYMRRYAASWHALDTTAYSLP